MADIPLVQEAPEQEEEGAEGFSIRMIRRVNDAAEYTSGNSPIIK